MHRSSGIAQFILMIYDWANKSVIGINAWFALFYSLALPKIICKL